jgi:hypothetical protein
MKLLNEGVNSLLLSISETPLDALEPIDGHYEAQLAVGFIEEAKKEFLSEGWAFNTDTNWSFLPDSQGYITLPDVAISVDPSAGENYTVKSGRIYNLDDKTFKFTAPVECDVIWEEDFDNIPQVFAVAILAQAKERFYATVVGVDATLQFLQKEAFELMVKARRSEIQMGDYSIFDDGYTNRPMRRNTNPQAIQ